MADLAYTEANVAVVFPLKAEIHTVILGAAVEAGQAVYLDSSGDGDLADASAAGTATLKGLALNSGGAGQAINILKRGHVFGFTLTQAYEAQIFLSDTAGDLADAAGTVSVPCGRVVSMTDKDRTKVLFFDIAWN